MAGYFSLCVWRREREGGRECVCVCVCVCVRERGRGKKCVFICVCSNVIEVILIKTSQKKKNEIK